MSEHSKKSVLRALNKELEDLEAQIKLGSNELEGVYREKHDIFSSLVKKAHDYITELAKNSEENLSHLKKNSKYLLDTLDKDFDFSYTEFEDTRHDLKSALHEFEMSLDAYYKELGNEAKSAKEKFEAEMQSGIEHFKAELALQQSYLDHLKDASISEWEEWKSSKLDDLEQLKGKINLKINESKQKAGKFSEEVNEAYDHLLSAFEELK